MVDIAVILGTRPEATKLAPVMLELRNPPRQFRVRIIATGQHRDMLPQTLGIFGLRADMDLDIMRPQQSLEHITSAALNGLEPVFRSSPPDLALVEGDTTTVFAAALAAFYHHVPVAHLEAGLRTRDRYNPFPEEINRRLASPLASLHLAPTWEARDNLLAEGHTPKSIYVTGNTAVDALLWAAARPCPPLPKAAQKAGRFILVTCHRRENWGEPLQRVCQALQQVARLFPDVEMVFPVHPNPLVRKIAGQALGKEARIHLLEPVEYLAFVHLMKKASLLLTDSGGIQEEAPALDKPVLVLREKTERPEGLVAGTAKLVGTDPTRIVREVSRLLSDKKAYDAMARAKNPFGDGKAAKRIRQAILHFLGLRTRRPADFGGLVKEGK